MSHQPANHQQPSNQTTRPIPPFWEIEWRVVEIAAEQLGFDREAVTAEARLMQDLTFDSLDAVEFVMELEEQFCITLEEDVTQEFFTRNPTTLHTVAKLVLERWGTGTTDRSHWYGKRGAQDALDSVPATQLGGRCHRSEWLSGQLYDFIGETAEGTKQFRRQTDGMRCLLLPGDEVMIGSSKPEAPADQRPAHPVTLSDFLIDAEPVSNQAFCRFLNSAKPTNETLLDWCSVEERDSRIKHFQLNQSRIWGTWSPAPGTENHPMMLVSWFGANAYSLWANRQDWRRYRGDDSIPTALADGPFTVAAEQTRQELLDQALPSESQWEYAAMEADASALSVRSGQHYIGREYTPQSIPSADVSSRLGVSKFGLHHMAGNVWQWCSDWYSPDFYSTDAARKPNPINKSGGAVRSERGGSWVGPVELTSRHYRRGRVPMARGRCLGFRCIGSVRDLP